VCVCVVMAGFLDNNNVCCAHPSAWPCTPGLQGSADYFVYCLNPATGALIWKYETTYVVVSPVLAVNETVVYVGADDFFYAFDADKGTVLVSLRRAVAVLGACPSLHGRGVVGTSAPWVRPTRYLPTPPLFTTTDACRLSLARQ
jgi:hypothetical protein